MKTSPVRTPALLVCAACISLPALAQESTPESPRIIHAVLRESDAQFPIKRHSVDGRDEKQGKRRSEKGKPTPERKKDDHHDRKKTDEHSKSHPDSKKDHHSDHKDRDDNQKKEEHAKKGDCPKEGNCPKSKAKEKPPIAKEGAKRPPVPLKDLHAQHREMMRKRFEEMRKQFGQNQRPHQQNAHRKPFAGRPPHPPQGQQPNHPQHQAAAAKADELRKELEGAEKELEQARKSLSMAHKELGNKSLEIKKLQDQVNNFRNQMTRAEQELRKLHEMGGQHKKLVAENSELRKHNEALKNDINVIKKKAGETVARMQADAKKHIEAAHAAAKKAIAKSEADADAKSRTEKEVAKGAPQAPRPDSKRRPQPANNNKSLKKPQPNKPGEPQATAEPKAEITPISFEPKSAVNYDERDRVLADVKALLEKSPNAKIKITGHADDSEYEQVNQDVSTNRAKFLASYLRVGGVAEDKITHQGVGNTSAPEKSEHNRRVVIEIVE